MRTRNRFLLPALTLVGGLVALAAAAAPAGEPDKTSGASSPSHQVIACYFHRTQRCPTCLRISSYIEESVAGRFPVEAKDGRVKVIMMDFQDPANARFTQAYGITGPTLLLMDVKDGKVVRWKPAPRVWVLVRDKDAFAGYVEGEVRTFLDAK